MSEKEVKEITRYKWEYGNFLEYVKKGKPTRAVIYAKALGIDRRTLVHWMSQPELNKAMLSAIDELMDGMQRAGKEDWRMYREVLDMLGINKQQDIDIKSDGEALRLQPIQVMTFKKQEQTAECQYCKRSKKGKCKRHSSEG